MRAVYLSSSFLHVGIFFFGVPFGSSVAFSCK